jgi:hypothetical protein
VIVVGGSIAELDDDLLQSFRAEGISEVVSTIESPADETDPLDPDSTVRRLVRTGRELARRFESLGLT